MVVVGILSDTHGILDSRVLSAFRTAHVSHIIHAGDVCHHSSRRPLREILDALQEIAPVTTVRGNTDDKYSPRHSLPDTAILEVGCSRFFIHHGDRIADPLHVLKPLAVGGWRTHGDIIVSGHSHKAHADVSCEGVLLLNPGSAGPPRFGNPATGNRCCLVDCADDDAAAVAPQNNICIRTVSWPNDDGLGTATISAWHIPSLPEMLPMLARSDDNKEEEPPPPTKKARRSSSPATKTTPVVLPNNMLPSGGPSKVQMTRVGTVHSLFQKRRRGAALEERNSLRFTQHVGIDGDAAEERLSARQVLLHARAAMPKKGDVVVAASRSPTAAASLPPGRRGENVFLDLDAIADAVSSACWPPPSGCILQLGGGGGVTLRITFACEPCQGGAKRAGLDSVKAFRGWREDACRGLLATVVTGGVVQVGDAVSISMKRQVAAAAGSKQQQQLIAATGTHNIYYQPMDAWVKGRMKQFIQRIPRGKVATYLQLATWAGAKPTSAYMRTIPSILKEEQAAEEEEKGRLPFATPSSPPVVGSSGCSMHRRHHRVVDTKSRVLTKYVPCHAERLREEGVEVSPGGEVPRRAIWTPTHEELFLVRAREKPYS